MSDRTFISRLFAITACIAMLLIICGAAWITYNKGFEALPPRIGERLNDLLILIFGGLIAWVAKSTLKPPSPPPSPPTSAPPQNRSE